MGRIHTSCVAAIVLSVAAFSVHAAENVVSNGNFEAAHWTSGYLENAGSKLIGWTIVGPCGISVPSGTYISTSIRSYDNSAWAFLKGVSSLSQDVTIDSDGDCILEFDFAGRPGNMNNAITKVSFGDTVLKIVYGDGGSQNGSKVAHHKIHFHATAGTHTLKFAQTASGDLSPALDNITLARVENSLAVTGNPATPGKPSPDYGTHYNLGTVTVSAPAVCTNSSGTAIYQCAGWKLFRLNAAGDWVFDATLANAEGQGNSFEYTPAANMVCKLVWLWSPSYLVSVSAGAGGSATVDGVSSNFYARGATCVLSAMPASPGAPAVWTGDTLPLGMSPTNLEFTTTVWAPMALTAKFNDVLWVDDDAASGGNGSYAAPYQTVDAALSAVAAGKCIAVMPGQYQLSGTKTISSAITVTGVTADFGDATVSSSNGARQAFKLTSSGAALRGLTVKGVGTQKAYGVVYLTAGLMENCRITGGLCNREASTYGSGVRNEGGTVRRCTMDGNTASGNIFTGLGLYQSSGLAEYCVITNNSGSIWHGSEEYPCPAGAYVSGGTLRGCLIARNSTGSCTESQSTMSCGFALAIINSPVVDGCAVVDNRITSTAGSLPAAPVYIKSKNPVVRNLVVQNNTDASGADLTISGTSTLDYSVLPSTDNVRGAGNRFQQNGTYLWTNNTFKLKPLSLALDSGIGLGGVDYGLDIYGQPRFEDDAMDMGPAEYRDDGSFAPMAAILVDSTTIEIPGTNVFSATCAGFPQGAVTYAWTRNGETVSTSPEWQAEWLDAGYFDVVLTVTSSDGTVSVSTQLSFFAYSKHIFLDASCATPTYPYASRATAATKWSDIAPLLMSGGSLTVYPGTYTATAQISLSFPYEIRGVGGRDKIVIQRSGSGRNIWLGDSHASARGLTFKGGANETGATMYLTGGALAEDVNLFGGSPGRNAGGGGGGCLFIDNGTIRDSTIGNVTTSQDIGYGIGVRMKGGTVERCAITNIVCTSMHLAAMHAQGIAVHMSAGTLRNCLVAKNSATAANTDNGRKFAVGIYQTGGKVENCTVVDNEFRYASVGLSGPSGYYTSTGAITNSIVFGNVSANTTAGTNCAWNVEGTIVATTTSCFTNNPVFSFSKPKSRPYYGLASSSPCIDAGDRLSWMDSAATDLAGAPRVAGPAPDLGCYEAPLPSATILTVK